MDNSVGANSQAGETDAELRDSEKSAKCQFCSSGEAKYRCPGCDLRTCSLGCSQGHKSATGKRKRTEFVKLANFESSNLLSDIRLLEDIGRETDAAVRREPPRHPRYMPINLKSLQKEAARRGIHLEFMAAGMQRREQNTSVYSWRKKKIRWHIEWHFVGIDLRIHDKDCSEERLVGELLVKHIAREKRHGFKVDEKLLPYTQLGPDGCVILMRHARCTVSNVIHKKIDSSAELGSQLTGQTILEFPTLLVLLPQEVADYKMAPDMHRT